MHASRVIVLITTIVLLCFPYQSVTAVRISVKHSRILVVMWLMGVFHFQIHCSSSQVSRTIKCQVGIKDDKSVAKLFIQATFDLPQDDKGSEES